MNNPENQYQEVNISDIVFVILKYKYIILSSTLFFSSLLLMVIFNLPNKFESQSKFYPSSDPGSTSSSMKLLSGISSLGGLSNFSLPTNEIAEYDVLVERIKSRDFLDILLKEKSVKENIFAAKDFSFEKEAIIYDDRLYDSKTGKYLNKRGDVILTPTIDDIYKKYLKMVNISRNKESGIMILSFTHFSPFFAAEMVDLILFKLDQVSRTITINEINKSLTYYKSELLTVSESELRNSLNALIKTKLEQLMLANVQEEYLINIISKSFIPKYKSEPKKSQLAIMGTVIIFLLSMLSVLLHDFFARRAD